MVINWQVNRLLKQVISLWGVLLLLLVLGSFIAPLNVDAQDEPLQILADQPEQAGEVFSEDLVLAVRLRNESISSGIFAIQDKGRYYLPIATLAEILNFYVDVDKDRGLIEGYLISDEDSFSIDIKNNQLNIDGENIDLPQEAFFKADVTDDDFYMLIDVFNQIWPVDLEVNLSALVLNISSDGTLPLDMLANRKIKQKRLMQKREAQAAEPDVYRPYLSYPYQLYGKPSIDVSSSIGYEARRDTSLYNLNVSGVQDLAYASADYAVNLKQEGGAFNRPSNIRLRFNRQNIHEGALPFGLEDTQWGDVRLKSRELVSSGVGGRGFIFSTKRNSFNNEFDMITVEGTGSPGWEVELYLNDQLIDFGVVAEDGLYRFEDVTITYGYNRIRTVLYGPQGQLQEKTENYFFQSSMLPPGKNEFSGGVVDQNKDLIPVDEPNVNLAKGVAANIYGARGINNNLTLFGSLNTTNQRIANSEIVSHKYASAGVIGSFGKNIAQGEIYKQFDGGSAVDLRTLSDFKGVKLNTQISYFNNFESPDARYDEYAKTFQFDFDIRKTFRTIIGSIGLDVGAKYLKLENGRKDLTLDTRQSYSRKGTSYSNSTSTRLSNSQHVNTNGRFSTSTRLSDWRLRNTLNYQTFPDVKGSSFQTELRYGKPKDFSIGLSALKNFDNQESILGFQITRDFKKFLGSVDTNWSSQAGVSLFLRASAAFGPYGSDDDYIMQSQALKNAGPVSGFVYRDLDYDGVFSEGDVPEPNTKMHIGRRILKQETDETGHVVELYGGNNNYTDVGVNVDSIDDPYLIAGNPGYIIYPRPGVMHKIQIPLIETGAIDGTVRYGTGKPIAGLLLELMKSSDGSIVKNSKTASDGYYTFERIPPGQYTIRAAPETGFNIPLTTVELTPDNLFQFGIDITVGDLTQEADVDLDFGVTEDGVMKVKDILSLAKGAKSVKGAGLIKKTPQTEKQEETKSDAVPSKSIKDIPNKDVGEKDSKSSKIQEVIDDLKVLSTPDDTKAKPANMNIGAAKVTNVRIGVHPDKTRVVLDLSAKTDYTLDYDSKTNTIFVELPFAVWTTTEKWKDNGNNFIESYYVEQVGSGVRLVMSAKEGAKVEGSGLLNADSGKKDRLYIDIARK